MTLRKEKKVHKFRKIALLFVMFMVCMIFTKNTAYATETTSSSTSTDVNGNTTSSGSNNNGINELSIYYNNNGDETTGLSANIKILIVLTIISLAPSLLIMLTSFTRIIVVLHFVRQALGTQTSPPNQVLVGLALFLTMFIMGPIFTEINDTAIKPLDAGEITQEEALTLAIEPLREFMFEQTQTKDIKLFMDIANVEVADTVDEIPTTVLIPSFIISELRAAFIMGFLIYIPFIIIDMVVASTLMSMGMMMLPPTTISMPFKILLFVLADGWNLVIGSLVKTFY